MLAAPCNAQAPQNGMAKGWYEDPSAEHGFYWYAQEEKKDVEKTHKETTETPDILPSVKPKSWPSYDAAWDMTPRELGNWIDRATQQAVRSPSEENVLRWAQYMDVARRKAMQFTNTWAWVMQKNPQFGNFTSPVSVPGRRAYRRALSQEMNRILAEMKGEFALLLFVDNGPFSKEAKQIAGLFMKDTGWPVKIIDMTKTPQVARVLGVKNTPQILLAGRHYPDPVPVAAGLVSVRQLKLRVVRALRIITGKNQPEEYGTPDFEKVSVSPPAIPERTRP